MFVIWSETGERNPSAFQDGIENVRFLKFYIIIILYFQPGNYEIRDLKFTHNVMRQPIGDFDELVFTVELGRSKSKEFIFFYFPQLMFVAIRFAFTMSNVFKVGF